MKTILENDPQQIHHLLKIEDQQGKCVIKLEDARCSIERDLTNVFGKDVKARYYAISHVSDIEFLTSSQVAHH